MYLKEEGKKKISKVYMLGLIILLALFFSFNFYAVNAEQISLTGAASTNTSKVSDEMFSYISEILKDVRIENAKIESRISEIRKSEPYLNYPTVRLNVDTPIFGISDYINRKLKITSDISASDLSSGYGILDVVKTNYIKIPSFTVGNFVVITREVKIEQNMTSSDATEVVFQLLKYRDQIKDVNKNLDSQIKNILFSYIGSEKISYINKINDNLSKVNKTNEETIKHLNQIEVLQYEGNIRKLNTGEYEIICDRQKSILQEVERYKEAIEKLPISIDSLKSIKNKTYELVVKSQMLNDEVAELYKNQVDTENAVDLIKNIKEDMNVSIKLIEDYIDNSVIQVGDNNSDLSDSNPYGISFNFQSSSNISYMLYNTTSKSYLVTLKNIREKVSKYLENTTGVEIYRKIETSDSGSEVIFSVEEKAKTLQDMGSYYLDFKTIETKYYGENNILLINDSKTKLRSIAKNSLIDVTTKTKNVYSGLEENYNSLKKGVDYTSIDNLKENIYKYRLLNGNILKYNIEINKIYNENLNNIEDTSRN